MIYRLVKRPKGYFRGRPLLFSIFFLILTLLQGCASKEVSFKKGAFEFMEKASNNATYKTKTLSSKKEDTLKKLRPIYKEISPLESKILSLSFKDENFDNVLYFLAKEAGLNLVISPEVYTLVPQEAQKISFQFRKQPLKNILESIMESLNLSYQIKRGVLYITPFEEKVFSLDFLHLAQRSEYKLGGDVLGGGMGMGGFGGGGETTGTPTIIYTPLKGKYEISGELKKKQVDIYTQLEESLKKLLSEKGVYTLNRLTGTLYVKDRPHNIKTISEFINNLKARYKKQVLIEAKIIEVELNKEHDMGIDWFEITNYPLGANPVVIDEISSSFTTRTNQPTIEVTIGGRPNINILLNFLKQYGKLKILSNPRLRVVHGQPALISVGRSIEFVKEVTRELVTAEQITREEISVTTSSIFDGVLLGVTPYITKSNEILLHVVPIKSDIVGMNRETFGENIAVTLPEVNLREITSIVKLKPGNVIILGGLILEKENTSQKKIAGLENIPILGNLFKREQKVSQKTELVIIIKVDLV